MTFYLGTHETSWLATSHVPLFVSRRRLARRKAMPRRFEGARWALDSGGFTELSLYGRWETSPEQYADEARRYAAEIGGLDFAAVQDWMVEPFVREKTGKTVAEHQRLSVESYLTLRDLAPEVPWMPVLQGWTIPEYHDHAAMYERAGVDLSSLPRVGVGSVCRRQRTQEGVDIFADLMWLGLRLHGFGLKTTFVKKAFELGLASFDSLAWSFSARRSARSGRVMDGCTHRSCANCRRWAEAWREAVISIGQRPRQLLLSMGCA